MNKVLVKVYFPIIDSQYDVWIPTNKKIYNVIVLLSKGVNELENGTYQPEEMPSLYNRLTGNSYNINDRIYDTDIQNGTELILI